MKYRNFSELARRVAAFAEKIAEQRARMVAVGIPVEGFDSKAETALKAINDVFGERLKKGGRRKVADSNLPKIHELFGAYFNISEEMRGIMVRWDHYAALKVEHDLFAAQMKPQKLVVSAGHPSAIDTILGRLVAHAAEPHLSRDASHIAFEKIFDAIKRGEYGEASDLQSAAQRFTNTEKGVINKIRTCHLNEAPADDNVAA